MRTSDSADTRSLERIRGHLDALKMTHTAKQLDDILAWATRASPSPSELIERLLAEEAGSRLDTRISRRIKRSGLKEQKTLEAFDWKFQPGLDRRVVMELATLNFVRQREDVLFTGKSGTGKSHLLQALALRACQAAHAVRYARCVDLVAELFAGVADGSYASRMRSWSRAELLVIDDVGLGQLKGRPDEPTAAQMLFDLIDRRHGKASTAMSSNINLAEWGRYLGDASLAAAILDRVAMRAIRIDIDGPSYRQEVAKQRAKPRKPAAEGSKP